MENYITNDYLSLLTEGEKARLHSALKYIHIVDLESFKSFLLVDIIHEQVLYVSKVIYSLNENKKLDYSFFDSLMSQKEKEKATEIYSKIVELFKDNILNNNTDYYLSYKTTLSLGGKDYYVHRNSMIIEFSESNKPWLVMSTTAPSTKNAYGDYVLNILGDKPSKLKYDFYKHSWEKSTLPELTDKEKKIAFLSSQGYSVEEIGEIACKSPNTVKSLRSSLFKKTDTTNTTEAVMFCINNNLF